MSEIPSLPEPARKPRAPRGTDRIFSDDEAEALRAMDAWKKRTGCKFPTITDMLAMLKSLGYRKDA